MRQAGATLQSIADKVDRTKERIRQILIQNHGSSRCRLISSNQLGKLSGVTRNRILKLYQDGIITPEYEFNTGNRHFLLWCTATVKQIETYYEKHRLCKICYRPIPNDRRVYCCEECSKEGHKYRYKSAEAKHRHIRNVKRYKEKHKLLAQIISSDDSRRQPLLVGAAGSNNP